MIERRGPAEVKIEREGEREKVIELKREAASTRLRCCCCC